jgi:hypothetical protein
MSGSARGFRRLSSQTITIRELALKKNRIRELDGTRQVGRVWSPLWMRGTGGIKKQDRFPQKREHGATQINWINWTTSNLNDELNNALQATIPRQNTTNCKRSHPGFDYIPISFALFWSSTHTAKPWNYKRS